MNIPLYFAQAIIIVFLPLSLVSALRILRFMASQENLPVSLPLPCVTYYYQGN